MELVTYLQLQLVMMHTLVLFNCTIDCVFSQSKPSVYCMLSVCVFIGHPVFHIPSVLICI